ncbi:MAG TPA: hypothetical protein VHY09_08750 [Candidatus Methylacidiphilales bacterium]|jgi:hypothetical protein|nr:hypothetical protein [Candidatus Methylacidiphilales bacterium]
MVSIIVAGRNDDYGINLSKRTAISLNYWASLCEPGDEILYVDCNTPPHLPTLTEAIADTLTPRARHYVKTWRVSGEQMTAAIGETPLPFSDELSRNVAIRRSNPANKWILSTNCDILLYPLNGGTIAQALRDRAPKFYVCPRTGIQHEQWQLLDRGNVEQIHGLCREIINRGFVYPPELKESWLRFASNGDFQLAPREQWIAMGGCEEAMKLWGHSDANNAKRLSLLNQAPHTPDLGDAFCVMHLEHNGPKPPNATPLPKNDWGQWVDAVTQPMSHNAANWGLKDVDLPLITLEKFGAASGKDILAGTRREGLVSRLITRTKARLWRAITPALRSIDERSGK